jgi:hypothetical protein
MTHIKFTVAPNFPSFSCGLLETRYGPLNGHMTHVETADLVAVPTTLSRLPMSREENIHCVFHQAS